MQYKMELRDISWFENKVGKTISRIELIEDNGKSVRAIVSLRYVFNKKEAEFLFYSQRAFDYRYTRLRLIDSPVKYFNC